MSVECNGIYSFILSFISTAFTSIYDSEKRLEAANKELESYREHLEKLVQARIAEVKRARGESNASGSEP